MEKWYGIGSSKTHNEFIEQLYENNEGYRNGLFEVIGKFKGAKKKILLRDRYGYCAVLPGDLTRGVTQKMTIKSALFKTEYLKEYLRQNNKNFYSYEYRIVSEYKIAKQDIEIIDTLGNIHKIKPSSLLQGCNPSIKSAIDKKDFIFRKVCNRNKYFKSGEVKYLDFFIEDQKTLLIVEDIFGKYIMDISVAYTGSRPTIEVAVDKDENLINRLKQNGDNYDYSKVKYSKMDDKVTICCEKHGCFEQRSHNHIRKEGCPKCGKEYKDQKWFLAHIEKCGPPDPIIVDLNKLEESLEPTPLQIEEKKLYHFMKALGGRISASYSEIEQMYGWYRMFIGTSVHLSDPRCGHCAAFAYNGLLEYYNKIKGKY